MMALRQSQPRLMFPLTMTPLLPIDRCSCEANMELLTMEKLLVPLSEDVDFFSRSWGVEPLRPCVEASTVSKNSDVSL